MRNIALRLVQTVYKKKKSATPKITFVMTFCSCTTNSLCEGGRSGWDVLSRIMHVCILIATAVHFHTFLKILAHGAGKGHRVSIPGVEEAAGTCSAQAEGDGGTA